MRWFALNVENWLMITVRMHKELLSPRMNRFCALGKVLEVTGIFLLPISAIYII